MQVKGPINHTYGLFFTDVRLLGIRLKSSQDIMQIIDLPTLNLLLSADPENNYSYHYEEIGSVKLHGHAFWAIITGKMISVDLPSGTKRYGLSTSGYLQLKKILPIIRNLAPKLKV